MSGKNKFTQYKDNPDVWPEENLNKIHAWAQNTYKTSFEKEDMLQASYVAAIMAAAILDQKKLKGQRAFRASFFYCLHNNLPTAFFDIPMSSIHDDFEECRYATTGLFTASNEELGQTVIMDVIETIWPAIAPTLDPVDEKILTTVLGFDSNQGQMSCRGAAQKLGISKTTVVNHTNGAIRRLKKKLRETLSEEDLKLLERGEHA